MVARNKYKKLKKTLMGLKKQDVIMGLTKQDAEEVKGLTERMTDFEEMMEAFPSGSNLDDIVIDALAHQSPSTFLNAVKGKVDEILPAATRIANNIEALANESPDLDSGEWRKLILG